MTNLSNLTLLKNRITGLDMLVKSYQWHGIILIPLFVIYLILDYSLTLNTTIFYKGIIIYSASFLSILLLISKITLFRNKFHLAHYLFLSGIMIISFVCYSEHPGNKEGANLLLAATLIGVVIINPKITFWFYIISFSTFLGIALYGNIFYPELTLIYLIAAIVVTGSNYWRNSYHNNINEERQTYQRIFETTQNQNYVLSEHLEILDLNKKAEHYFLKNNVQIKSGLKFHEVFVAETDNCMLAFETAFSECRRLGYSKFAANCSIVNKENFIPKEFTLRQGEFFGQKVYIVGVETIQKQRDYERQLIENKNSITKVLENISSFVFNISFDENERFKHKVNYVSPKVEEVYGYSVDEYIALVKAERISKDRHPEDLRHINKNFEDLLKKGGDGKWRFRMKINKNWRWIEEKIFIEKDPNSTMVSLLGIVKDVTEEIEAQTRLVESEQRYRQLFESNLAGVYKTNLNGDILDCNMAFAKILGYDNSSEIQHLNISNIYFEEKDRKEYLKLLMANRSLSNYTSTVKRKDGRRLILNNNVAILQNEEGLFENIVGSIADVTDLHETSLALKHSEEKYRLLFEESNNAILIFVLDEEENVVVDVNSQAEILFGATEGELIGKKVEEISANSVEANASLSNISRSLKEGKKIDTEWQFKRKDQSDFYAEVSFVSIMLDEERVAQVVIKDISERKKHDQEILESRLSFKNVVDQSPDSVMIFTENRLAYLNPNGEHLYMNVLESKGKSLFEIFPAQTHLLLKDLIKEANNDISSYTEIDLGSDNELKKYSINVVRSIYNRQKAHIILLHDISLQIEYNQQMLRAESAEETNKSLQEEIDKHKATQESLIQSTSRFTALLESTSNLFICSLNDNYEIVGTNKNFQRMMKDRLGVDVVLGSDFLSMFPIEPHAQTYVLGKFKEVLQGKNHQIVTHFPTNNGEIWLETFMNPIKIAGKPINEMSFIAHDITDQIENKKKIIESEENNRAVLQAIPDVLFKINDSGIFTDFRASSIYNEEAFYRFTTDREVIGKRVKDLFIDKIVAQKILQNVTNCLETGSLITHNFSVTHESDGLTEKVHYENRYSNLNNTEVVVISRNVTDTVEYEEKLIDSVKEKEILLKEVHHRVKNNLQVINSILNLQSSYIKDEETLQIIIESQNRIRSMSYIHESLYQTKDFSSIRFNDYITNLVQNLVHSYEVKSDDTKLTLNVDDIDLALDQAIPCGLILNELITNSLKYAYPIGVGGEITISVIERDGKVHVSVKDQGVGLPKGFKISETDSLGLSLVDTLIDQLDGELILKTESGTEFLIIFEKQEF
jgi:PAS domain S-box-containing protein